ncbi:CBS domain-containing protein [Pseudonocardia endophytica]|uniref:CBS domain protein n=1 Tax=Pseudonocardia endophytica TaxID=401976 RepID=A0A4V2PIY7_PSEEN|nr:CBS domain-containing protein [Pseudonocardia endophytica]TCK26236.1 CBS domain protein [Pseudonocardia endophytica]
MGHDLASVVADAMIRFPKLCGTGLTVGEARTRLLDDHVHALLVVADGVLVAVVERDDLAGAPAGHPAWPLGRLDGRTVSAGADLRSVTRDMAERGRRRFAVVAEEGRLVGLLCRKRSGRGFCDDDGVAARAADRRAG